MPRGCLGLDLSPSLNGYAFGCGTETIVADAWEFSDCGDDLGIMACELDDRLDQLFDVFDPAALAYEEPIKRQWDKLWTVRRIYGLGWGVERYCRRRGVPYREASVQKVKAQMTGDQWADKTEVVKAARAIGVILPKKGEKDAADATGVMLYGMAEFNPETWAYWDSRLRSTRGQLL